ERDMLRASGLLALVVPAALGGAGASWSTTMRATRIIARTDPSIAHVFGFQHLLLVTVRLFGTRAQFERLARATASRARFSGNSRTPLDPRLALRDEQPGGRVLRGSKSFCSGARDSDVLVFSARDAHDELVVGVLPSDRAGIVMLDDWDAMGQRQT